MMSHGLASSRMFLGAYMIYKVFGTRNLFLIKGVIIILPLITLLWFFSVRANIGIPPTLNLQSELMLVARIIKISKFFIVPLFFSLLFRAAYRLLLYSSTQHGYFRNKVSPFFNLRYNDGLCIFFHLLPIYILIVKGGEIIN